MGVNELEMGYSCFFCSLQMIICKIIPLLMEFHHFSLLEMTAEEEGSGLSVLRTFRLLRILKLVRFMPALKRQLVIMLRTLDNVAVFFALLVLFIFIFR